MKKTFVKGVVLILVWSLIFFTFVACHQPEDVDTTRSIFSILKTSTDGLVDTYTITYTDGSKSTFIVTNGADGIQGIQGEQGVDGHTPTITIQNGYWYIDGVNTNCAVGDVVQGSGNSETSVMSQKAVTDRLKVMQARLDIFEGRFEPKFEIGRVAIDDNKQLVYSDNRFEIRTAKDEVYGVAAGTSFSLRDYTTSVLIVYYSYDEGQTYTAISRNANNTSEIVIREDALVAIRLYQNPSASQKDLSLSELLVVELPQKNASSGQDGTNFATVADLNHQDLWENGGITAEGKEYKSSKSLRTKDYISPDVRLIYAEGSYTFMVFAYDESDHCIGVWNGKEFSTSEYRKLYYFNPAGVEDGIKLRLMLYRFDATDVDVNECINVHFLNTLYASIFYPTPTLTFIDDDGSLEALQNWESIADEIGISITAALVTGIMGEGDKNPRKASWDDVERLQNKGFEFVSHTHTHIKLTTTKEETIIQQFKDSIAALKAHGCESRYLVYPYNAITPELMELVQQYFVAGIGLGGGNENTLPIYTYHIRRYSINDTSISVEKEYNGEIVSAHSFKTLEELKSYIDDAYTNGGWVIIMTHLRNDGSFYFDEEVRQMIIDLCKYATQKGFEIQTFGEAYERYQNIMEQGTIDDAEHYVVDCNGVVHSRGE